MPFNKVGSEFLVNTTTAEFQSRSSITALTDGRFVVTWDDSSRTGGDTSIAVRGQIFAADGSTYGPEFLVNTTTIAHQLDSSMTALADGRFVVTWTDESATGGDTSGYAVRGQIFTAFGARSGPEFLVNTTTTSYQLESSVTALADGRFVVTWTDQSATGGDTSVYAVRGQIFDANGANFGTEFLVNTTTTNNQFDSSVTALADGRFVVTWTDVSFTSGDTSGYAVRGQIFAATGVASGPEFLVNTTTSSSQFESSITALADGRFVVTWTDESATGGDTSGRAVRGQIFAADGSTSGPEFLVNTTTTGGQYESSVTALADGRFVVTWTDYSVTGGDTSFTAVRGQMFAADGTKSGTEFLVNTTTAAFQNESSITALADGRFVVAWTDQSGTVGDPPVYSAWDVRGQIFDALAYTGDASSETITGGSLGDTITGGGGLDIMRGEGGNDTFVIAAFSDVVGDVIDGGAGTDTIRINPDVIGLFGSASISSIERVEFGTSNFYAEARFAGSQVGSGLATNLEVDGGSAANTSYLSFNLAPGASLNLSGFTFSGGMNRVTTTGSTGAEVVYGSTILDLIYGDAGTDTLWGSYGADGAADALEGGDGSDTYFVYETSDVVTETNANTGTGGLDLVYSFSNRTLSANVEYLTLFGNNAALNSAIGNDGDNALNAMQYVGGSGINFVDDIGNDVVFASYYADTISTGMGNDTLWGSWGADGAADAMTGGDGADTYYVQEALDIVIETNAGTGPSEIDTVYSAIDMTLGANLEYLFIYGNATLAAGNSLDNALIGSYSGLQLTFNGFGGSDYITGGGGNDTIDGGAGVDFLTGSGGADTFKFTAGEANGDYIIDFDGAGAGGLDSL